MKVESIEARRSLYLGVVFVEPNTKALGFV